MGLGYVALQCIDQHEARRRFDIAVDLLLSGEPEIFKADIEEIADIFARDLGDEQAAEQLRQIAERAASA
jgi:galactose-1-phosphate uridylyltransferase